MGIVDRSKTSAERELASERVSKLSESKQGERGGESYPSSRSITARAWLPAARKSAVRAASSSNPMSTKLASRSGSTCCGVGCERGVKGNGMGFDCLQTEGNTLLPASTAQHRRDYKR